MSTLQTAVAAMIAVAAWCWPADDENEDPWAADHLDKDDNL